MTETACLAVYIHICISFLLKCIRFPVSSDAPLWGKNITKQFIDNDFLLVFTISFFCLCRIITRTRLLNIFGCYIMEDIWIRSLGGATVRKRRLQLQEWPWFPAIVFNASLLSMSNHNEVIDNFWSESNSGHAKSSARIFVHFHRSKVVRMQWAIDLELGWSLGRNFSVFGNLKPTNGISYPYSQNVLNRVWAIVRIDWSV